MSGHETKNDNEKVGQIESDEGGSSDDDDDGDEEEEPKLKYERIGNSFQEILSEDAASCMTVHSKFLALGTHNGVVHILDHQGNRIRNKKFPSHTTIVHQISIESNGEYVASCSGDGRVSVNGLYTAENNVQHSFDCPIKAVALHPDYGHRGNKQYAIGVGEKLTLYEKGWLRNKSTILHAGVGYVHSIKWRGKFIAWAHAQGVEVYDTQTRVRISHIEKEDMSKHHQDLYQCNICWKDEKTIFIAWADVIKVCVVKQRLANDVRDLPTHYVEIVHLFKTDFFSAGIAPFGDELAVLAYFQSQDESSKKGNALRPHLFVLKPNDLESYDETSTDVLSVRGYEEYLCINYHLEHVEEEQLFYIVSPKDIVIARPRDLDDNITYLLEREDFEKALSLSESRSKELKKFSALSIGKAYLDYLVRQHKFNDAAQMCDRVLGVSKQLWEEQVYIFAQHKQLKAITPNIPYRNPTLDSTIYEMVLNAYLQTDYEGFHNLISDWPTDLYRSKTIIHSLKTKLKEEPEEEILLRTLATLYIHEKNFSEALQIYLSLGHAEVFEMIEKHKLIDFIQDKCIKLMEIDSEKATELFTANTDALVVDSVVKQLRTNKKLLHQYLHALFMKDKQLGQNFHDLQVELYAEYQRARLLPFLRNSNYYQLEKAFIICEDRDYTEEMVFLLGRMGNSKKALMLIIERLEDINKAIDFAKEEHDEDLWDDLITHCLDKPLFIKELLFNIGTHVDPKKLIKRIPPGLKIPNLRDALVKILQDFNLQVSLHEGCKTILDKDSIGLVHKQVRTQNRGYAVTEDAQCNGCQGRLIVNDSRKAKNLVCFGCQHFFHAICLQQSGLQDLFCSICASRKSNSKKKSFR